MPSSPSPLLRVELQALGENLNTWGDSKLNDALARIEDAIAGVLSIAVEANVTLTTTNYVDNQSRHAVLVFTGSGGFTITAGGTQKIYLIHNQCSAAVTMSDGGTTVSIPSGQIAWVYSDGTDFYKAEPTDFASQKITNVATGTASTDGVNFGQLQTYLPLAGGTMTGAIVLPGAPTADLQAATKAYVDSLAFAAADLPGQAGNAGKFLTTDGSASSWGDVAFSAITSAPTTLSGYGITDGQPLSGDLTAIAALSTTSQGRSVLTFANPGQDRLVFYDDSAGSMAALSLGGGLSISASTLELDPTVATIAALTPGADTAIHFTGTDTAATHTQTPFARTLLDDADAATARGTLGLGTAATSASTDFLAAAGGTVTGDITVSKATPRFIASNDTAPTFVWNRPSGRSYTSPNDAGTWRLRTHAVSYTDTPVDRISVDANDVTLCNNAGNAVFTLDGTNDRVGIGTTSPEHELHVVGTAKLVDSLNPLELRSTGTTGTTRLTFIDNAGQTNQFRYDWTNDEFQWFASSTEAMTLTNTGELTVPADMNATAFNVTSDRSLKENIAPSSYGLAEVMAIAPCEYDMIADGRHRLGFVHQDVRPHIPEAAPVRGDGIGGLDGLPLIAVLWQAVREQQARIEALEASA